MRIDYCVPRRVCLALFSCVLVGFLFFAWQIYGIRNTIRISLPLYVVTLLSFAVFSILAFRGLITRLSVTVLAGVGGVAFFLSSLAAFFLAYIPRILWSANIAGSEIVGSLYVLLVFAVVFSYESGMWLIGAAIFPLISLLNRRFID